MRGLSPFNVTIHKNQRVYKFLLLLKFKKIKGASLALVKYKIINGKKQKIYDKFSDILIGSITDTASKKEPKKKKDITTTQFLRDPKLVRKYGLWGDTDMDQKINMFDSFPFDPRRHGLFSAIKSAVSSVINTAVSAFNTISGGGIGSTSTSSGSTSTSTSTSSGGTSGGSTGGTSGGGGGGYTTGFIETPTGTYITDSSGNIIGSAAPITIPKPKVYGGGTYNPTTHTYTSPSGVPQSTLNPPKDATIVFTNPSAPSANQSPLQRNIQQNYQRQGYTAQQAAAIAQYSIQNMQSPSPDTIRKILKGSEPMNYYEPNRFNSYNGGGAGIQDSGNSANIPYSKVPVEQRKNLLQKAWKAAVGVENKIFNFVERNTPEIYVKVKPTFGGFGTGWGGITTIPERGTVSAKDIKNRLKEEESKSYSQENLNKKVGEINQVADILNKKWGSKIEEQTTDIPIGSKVGGGYIYKKEQVFTGTEDEYKQYQQDYQDYQRVYNNYIDFKKKVEENSKGVFNVLKQGGQELLFKAGHYMPTTVGGLGLRGAEVYGVVQAAGAVGAGASSVYAGMAPAEQALLSATGTGFDIFVGVQGVKGFTNPELSPGQRVTSLGFGLTGFSSLAGKGGKMFMEDLKAAETPARIAKTTVRQQLSVDDAVLIRTNADGSKMWRVEGNIITDLKDAKTGKVIRRVQTDTFSDVVTAQTKEGAVKATADTYAASLNKAGLRSYAEKSKVTVSKTGTKATGEFTFRQSERNPNLIAGRGDTTINEIGTLKGTMTKEEANLRFIRKKAQAESRALTELISGKVGEKVVSKRLAKGVEVSGKEQTSLNLYRSDVTKERLPVRQYYRGVKPKNLINKIIEKSEYKFVKPYVRRYAKQQIEKRTTGAGLSKAFTPEEISLNLSGFKVSKKLGPKANLSSTAGSKGKSGFGLISEEKLNLVTQTQKERFAAKASAEAQTRALASKQETSLVERAKKSPGKQASELISKTKVKSFSILSKAWGAENASRTRLLSKERSASAERTIMVPLAIFKSDTIVKEREKQSAGPATPLKIEQKPLVKPQIPKGGEPTSPVSPLFPGEKPPKDVGYPYLPRKKEALKKETPYDAYAYVEATKRNKARYVKLNRKPLTQESAASMMARYVDENISARGKVTKAPTRIQKGKKQVQIKIMALDTGDRYYDENKRKFRLWRTRKQLPLPSGVVIERQAFRLDSPGETEQIQKAGGTRVRNFFGF